ncbi:hypothetical protein [Sphingobium estronivorans]|uniref:hypothetical protein n=1 Tax=Sphingobium estronivorans TaxID=1577690 RepID=UPI0012399752|nr:hypothetical protein [Sphingobium estronivorans]
MQIRPIVFDSATVRQRRRRRRDWATIAYATLHLTGFAAGILLMSWGVFILFFLTIGGFSIDGLMHQLGNLTARYLVADPLRAARFQHQLLAVHALITLTILFLRRHRLLRVTPGLRSARHG